MVKKHADGPTVMVVEELAGDCSGIKKLLETRGFRLMEASNVPDAAEDASDFTGRERPDLILLDLSRPLPDELPAIRHMREGTELRGVPIVAFSDHCETSSRTDALAAGCSELVTKPVNIDRLRGLLDGLLTKHQKEREAERARYHVSAKQ